MHVPSVLQAAHTQIQHAYEVIPLTAGEGLEFVAMFELVWSITLATLCRLNWLGLIRIVLTLSLLLLLCWSQRYVCLVPVWSIRAHNLLSGLHCLPV